jgi:hypothetical protein
MKWVNEVKTGPGGMPPQDYIRREDMVSEIVAALSRHDHELAPMVRASVNAVGAMSEATRDVGTDMRAFEQGLKQWQSDLRSARVNFIAESGTILNALKEVRQFFSGPSYEQEMNHLRELAGLCERLSKLRENGVIESLTDTIIRLSLKPE